MSKIPLNQFITLQRGFDLPSHKRISGTIPVVASTGIVGYHNEAKVKADGVVIGRSGSIGGGQFIQEDFFPLNTTLYVKDFKGHHPRFVYYLLKNIDFTQFNVGSGVPTLNRNHLDTILIEDLGIGKEILISDILGSLDDKIQLNTQINQTLEQIAQTIFKSWFIDFDPVHAKANALASGQTAEQAIQAAMTVISGKNTQELHRLQTANPEQYQQLWEIAEAFPSGFSGDFNSLCIPKGWAIAEFKDFVVESRDKVGSLPNVPEYSVTNTGIHPRDKKFTKNLSKKPEKNKLLRKGNLVFGMSREILNWGIMKDEVGGVSSAYHIYQINGINTNYLNFFISMKSKYFLDLIKPSSREGQSFDKNVFLNKKIYIPSDELVCIFGAIHKNIFSQIDLLIKQNESLNSIRDELLPKLLSGEV